MADSNLPIIGKTVADVAFFSDPETPWEVSIRFSDGSSAYISKSNDDAAEMLFCGTGDPDWKSYPIRREILS